MHKNMKNNKGLVLNKIEGFTLIEMLVVIAVIGILSAATLTALGPARNKAKDTKVIGALNNFKAIAEVKYDTATGFDYLFGTTKPEVDAIDADIVSQQGELIILGSATSPRNTYLAYSKLPSNPTGKFFCVDSTGNSKELSAAPSVTAEPYQCP